MAVSGSGVFGLTLRDGWKGTIVLNLDLETHKMALFTNSITPNYTTDTAYGVSPYASNEVSGTGYTAGGVVVTSTTVVASAGILTIDSADPAWTGATFSSARCGLWYADALAGNNAICLFDFGADFSVTASTFTLVVNASGLIAVDYIP